jgi:hypothetical protein
VKLVYSAIFFFTEVTRVSPVGGELVVQGCLQVVEEMVVVRYLVDGFARDEEKSVEVKEI